MSVKSSTELMLYVVLPMPTLNKAYLLFIITMINNHWLSRAHHDSQAFAWHTNP
jgi:hypothetical protein